MKLTQQQLIDLLQAAGLKDAVLVENDTDADFALDTALQTIDAARTPLIRPKIEEEVKRAMAGLAGGKLESLLANLTGISRSAFKNIEHDADKGRLALEHYAKKFSQDTEGLRNEMSELVNTHNATIERLQADHAATLKAANDKYTERDIIEHIADELKSAPLPKGSNLLMIARDVYGHIKNEAQVVWDDKARKAGFRTLDNPEVPVYLNEAKSQFKGVLDYAAEKYKPMGEAFWQRDMRTTNAEQEMNKYTADATSNINAGTQYHQTRTGYHDPIKAGNDVMLAWSKGDEEM
jgi:hypothetical protein